LPSFIGDIGVKAGRIAEIGRIHESATKGLIQRSDGIHHTIVNGRPIYQNGRLTGEVPGEVLRGSAYCGRQAAAA